jgi:di/tricarboxylate transporter
MPFDRVATVCILAAVVVLLILERLPGGLVGIAGGLALVLTGVLDAPTLLGCLSHEGVVSVAGMFVISAAVTRTGALGFVADAIVRRGGRGASLLLILVLITSLISAFLNSTAVVLVMIPIVLAMCERLDEPPSRYLIPLAYAAILGGSLTLIGTSTNVIAVAEAGRAAERILGSREAIQVGLFTFTPLGLCAVAAGAAYLVLVGRRLLPDRTALSMTLSSGVPVDYVTEVEIGAGSKLGGRTVSTAFAQDRRGLRLLQLIRSDVVATPHPDLVIQAGDVLLLKGPPGEILALHNDAGTTVLPASEPLDGGDARKPRNVDLTLAELIVGPLSNWIGKRIDALGIRALYDVAVIAIQRHGHHIRASVGRQELAAGDTLLVQGTVEGLRKLRASDNVVLLEGVEQQVALRSRAPFALAALVAFAILVSFTDSVSVAAVTIAAALVLVRCLTFQEATRSLDWNVLLLLAGSLSLGLALQKTGLAADTAGWLVGLTRGAPAWVTLGCVYVATLLITEFVSNGTAAALMIPIGIEASARIGVAPLPFVMAVAFAASAAFVIPMGYQVLLFVYGTGGYRLRDYVLVGLPLDLILAAVAIGLIPVFYPF